MAWGIGFLGIDWSMSQCVTRKKNLGLHNLKQQTGQRWRTDTERLKNRWLFVSHTEINLQSWRWDWKEASLISKFKRLLRFLKRKLTKWSFKTFSINYKCKLISWIVIATHISRISKIKKWIHGTWPKPLHIWTYPIFSTG